MTTTVNIAPEVLDWVIKSVAMTAENEKAYESLKLWRTGNKAPTFNQLEEVSKALHIPFGYFFLCQPPQEDYSFLKYRTVYNEKFDNPSRELIDTVQHMVSIQDWMHEYVIRTNDQQISIVGSGKNDASVEALATRIRNDLELPTNWYEMTKDADDSFKILRERGEAAGIVIMMSGIVGNYTKRTLNIEEFRAFTLIDNYAPLIFINATDTMNGRLFSLAHEMAHVWVGQNSVFNGSVFQQNKNDNYIEVKCNAVAAEILIPRTAFKAMWENDKTLDYIKKICQFARYFKCSTTAVARRAFDFNYIDKSIYNTVVNQAQTGCAIKAKKTGGNYYSTMGTRIDMRLLFALASSISSGATLYTEAYKLTNTNRTTFSKLLELTRG